MLLEHRAHLHVSGRPDGAQHSISARKLRILHDTNNASNSFVGRDPYIEGGQQGVKVRAGLVTAKSEPAAVLPRKKLQPRSRCLAVNILQHNVSATTKGYANDQPAGFANRIERVAIVGVSLKSP